MHAEPQFTPVFPERTRYFSRRRHGWFPEGETNRKIRKLQQELIEARNRNVCQKKTYEARIAGMEREFERKLQDERDRCYKMNKARAATVLQLAKEEAARTEKREAKKASRMGANAPPRNDRVVSGGLLFGAREMNEMILTSFAPGPSMQQPQTIQRPSDVHLSTSQMERLCEMVMKKLECKAEADSHGDNPQHVLDFQELERMNNSI